MNIINGMAVMPLSNLCLIILISVVVGLFMGMIAMGLATRRDITKALEDYSADKRSNAPEDPQFHKSSQQAEGLFEKPQKSAYDGSSDPDALINAQRTIGQLQEQIGQLRDQLRTFEDIESLEGHIGDERYHFVRINGIWYNARAGELHPEEPMPLANPDHLAWVQVWLEAIEVGYDPEFIIRVFGTLITQRRPTGMDLNGDGKAETPTGEPNGASDPGIAG